MIYFGLAAIGITMSCLAAEIVPQIRAYMRKPTWDRTSEPRTKTLININGELRNERRIIEPYKQRNRS
jgi:hypothetical protein